jgi:hypothetical protein
MTDKIPFSLCLTYTPSMQMNLNIKDSTLIGENSAVREEVEIKLSMLKSIRIFDGTPKK